MSTVILEALGYETDVKVLSVPVTYASMAKGDIDKDGLVLIVPIRTHKAEQINFDSTCVLQKYEHEWLRFESYIEYKRARLVLADDLMNELNKYDNAFRETANNQVLLRIIDGFCRSKFAPQKIKRYLNCAKTIRSTQPQK